MTAELGVLHPIRDISFSSDASLLLVCTQDNAIRVLDVATQARVQLLSGHTDWVNQAYFHPEDHNRVISCSDDRSIRDWNVGTGRPGRITFESKTKLAAGLSHDGFVWDVCFSPDASLVCTCSADRTARLWDACTGEQLFQLTGHEDDVKSCHFNRNGRLLITGSDDKSVRVWRTSTGEQCQKMTAQTKVTCIRVANHSDRIAVSFGSTVMVLDIDGAEESARYSRHSALVRCCDWSPDDRCILSGSNDKTAVVYDLQSEQVSKRPARKKTWHCAPRRHGPACRLARNRLCICRPIPLLPLTRPPPQHAQAFHSHPLRVARL